MQARYRGGCHCGRVQFEVEADVEAGPNGICNCTSCTMKGFLHHHVPRAKFSLLSGFDDLKLYKFGTLSAEHYFCKYCGVESFYRSRSDPDFWDVNLRCLRHTGSGEPVDIFGLTYELIDGAHWEEWQAARAEARAAKPWRLLAPAHSVDPALDAAASFRASWEEQG